MNIPPEVLALAARAGARPGVGRLAVRMRQSGTLRQDPQDGWKRFTARQTTRQDAPVFDWRARIGPLGLVTVLDRLSEHGAQLDARLLNLVQLDHAGGYGPVLKGEIIRYLAELAWSPDAILQNPQLRWSVPSVRALAVGCRVAGQQASVTLNLGADGLIHSVHAADRPRLEDKRFVERPWVGRFWDYRLRYGRRVPFAAEVAWIVDGAPVPVWRGRIEDWTPLPAEVAAPAVSAWRRPA